MWRVLLLLMPASILFAQEDSGYAVEKLLGGFRYASSTVWGREQFLLIGDLSGAKITRVDGQGSSVYREGVHPAGLAYDADGKLLICDPVERHVLRIDKKGKQEILADRYEGKRLNGPNGIVVSKNGHIWFTDPAFATADKERELGWYGVYHIPPKGEIDPIAKLTTRPNGIALSPDGRTLYVVDSDSRSVLAWDVDKSGAATGQRTLLKVPTGVPNGIHATADGRLYVAARRILIYDTAGKPLGDIELAERPVDMTLGDSDLTSIYVAAGSSVYRVRTKPKGGKSN